MKKTYQVPATTIVTLAPHTQILADSPNVLLKSGPANKDAEVLSRQSSNFWDDED